MGQWSGNLLGQLVGSQTHDIRFFWGVHFRDSVRRLESNPERDRRFAAEDSQPFLGGGQFSDPGCERTDC